MKTLLFLIILINQTLASYNESYKKLNPEEQKTINEINIYFDNLNTLKTNFLQYDENNQNMSEGTFYIKKPEKLRFEYNNPFKNLLIVNGKITTFYDIDLDEISTFSSKSTPIFFLLNKNGNLENINSTIIKIKKTNEDITIKTSVFMDDTKYYLDYIFDKNINNLKSINFRDGNGQNITLTLFNTEKNIDLDKNLFIFKNPRLYKNRK